MNDTPESERADRRLAREPGQGEADATAHSRTERETVPPSSAAPKTGLAESMPTQFGRYRIVKELGQGGMGWVYLAEDTELKRQVALKIPKFPQQQEPELLERFYREAQSAATLHHPNICPVYDIGEHEGTRYITMAYVSGPPLSQLVGSPKLRSERTIAKLVRKIALGLAAAHGKGILHRDLKPGNILLDERNEPVITDFGLARRVEQNVEQRLTQEGTLLGTPAYMSPEQIGVHPERMGPASDVYSLGVILYELLTGQLPYQGPIAAVLGQIIDGKPKPPSELRSGLDKRMEAICVKMMACSVDNRYASAGEVAAALSHYLEQTAAGAKSSAGQFAGAHAKLEEHKQHTISLLKQGKFNEAAGRLQKLTKVQGAGAEPYVEWATAELDRLKAVPSEVREQGPAIVESAIELIASHDYAEAGRLLRAVPDEYRSPEAAKLLDKVTKLEQETERLNARMHQAVSARQYDGLQDDLSRLVEIQPGNLTARELHAKLSTYGAGQPYRFDKSGNLLPSHRTPLLTLLGEILSQSLRGYARRQQYRTDAEGRKVTATGGASGRGVPIVPVAIGLAAFALILIAIVIFLRDGRQTVRVEIDQEILADTSMMLLIDGEQTEIAGIGETIKLKPGDHKYELRDGDGVVRSDEFTVLKGDNPPLVIRLDAEKSPDSFVSLFNGRDLTGWHGDPRLWRVVDGTIVGSTEGVDFDSHSYLCTKKSYRDFILSVKFKLREGNSGIQFRSEQLPDYKAAGYQAEIGWRILPDKPNQAIGLFFEGQPRESKCTGRDQLLQHVNDRDWNEYVITCRGRHITLQLNGFTTVDYTEDQPSAEEGVIGFQIMRRPAFGFQEMRVEFKDIRIMELPDPVKSTISPEAVRASPVRSVAGPASHRTARLAEWENLKYGMFIHFGMSTFTGVNADKGDSPSTTYAPANLDVRQWIRVAKQAGMKYAVLTAKHHSGHCLWDSSQSDYDVATSGNKTDVVAEFMDACRAEGIKPGIYYSIPDGHNEGGVVRFSGAPVSDEYFALIKNQITELHSSYPGIYEQWLDVTGRLSPEQRSELYQCVKSLSPDCLVVMAAAGSELPAMQDERWPSDVVSRQGSPTQTTPHDPSQSFRGRDYYLPLEVADTIVKGWWYKPTRSPKSVDELRTLWEMTMGRGANLLLNVPPDQSGRIPDQSVAILMALIRAVGNENGR
jgi:alpha-L-fucosidase